MKKKIPGTGPGIIMILAAAAFVISMVAGWGCWNKEKKPPVILVIIDTFPAGHCSCYGYERSTTPSLDRLAGDGVRFSHAIAPSPWTLPSLASILTGTLPSRHQAGLHLDPWTQDDRKLARMRPGMVTLADLFREDGYQTVGFFNNPFAHGEFGLDQGFDLYDYAGGDNLSIREAAQVVNEAAAWIEQNGDKPFFMALHFFDPHLAFNPPLSYAAPYISGYQGELKPPFNPDIAAVRKGLISYTDEDKRFILGLYDGELASTDAELGRFMSFLKSKELYESALVIVTSDHGEEFWEHGGFEHGHSLHREVLEVPLVIKFPGSDFAGKSVEEYVSLMDILPTVAEHMGWPLPFSLDGVSLYPRAVRLRVQPHIIVSENLHYGPQQQAFYAEGIKLIYHLWNGRIVIYDLKNDPLETRNVFGDLKLPRSVKNQIKYIAGEIESLLKAGKAEAAEVDRETLEKLRSLGYISK
jgi:arylsulfatase A-like enzyme